MATDSNFWGQIMGKLAPQNTQENTPNTGQFSSTISAPEVTQKPATVAVNSQDFWGKILGKLAQPQVQEDADTQGVDVHGMLGNYLLQAIGSSTAQGTPSGNKVDATKNLDIGTMINNRIMSNAIFNSAPKVQASSNTGNRNARQANPILKAIFGGSSGTGG